ncbi:hypothetical protein D3C76_1600070 [compost metagenome]
MAKLFLIKGNRLLLNHRLSLPAENRARAALAPGIGKLVQAAYAASGADKQSPITRFDVDEAQIIYSYLQSAAGCSRQLEEGWLSEGAAPALLEEAALLLLEDQAQQAAREAAADAAEAESVPEEE